MPYKITIEETREVIATTGKEWAVIGEKQVENDPRWREPDDPSVRVINEYGYTPEVEKKVTVTRTILLRELDDLDVSAVIAAVNGLQL